MPQILASRERAETSLQSVVLVPVVFLVVFMCFHLAALVHQGHVAMAISARGAEISSNFENQTKAQELALIEMKIMAQELGAQFLKAPRIRYEANSVLVDVWLRVDGAVPFMPRITMATSRQNLERFVSEQDRE